MDSDIKAAIVAAVVIIVAAVVVTALLPHGDAPETEPRIFPDPIQDGDKDYTTAAAAQEEYGKALEALSASLSDSSLDARAMAGAMKEMAQVYYKIEDEFSWVCIDYNIDPEGMDEENQAWTNLESTMCDSYAIALKNALSGPCASTVEDAMELAGLDPETYRSYGEMTAEEKALIERETELVSEYNLIMTTEYEVVDSQGRTWTLDSVKESATLTDEEKTLLVAEIYEAQFSDAAAVYVDLVDVRNDYAEVKGYDNYAVYSYEKEFGRDYTVSDAKGFIDLVSRADSIYMDIWDITGYTFDEMRSDLSWMYDLEGAGLIDAVKPFIDSVSGDFARLLDYMTEYELIYNCDADGHIEDAFTGKLYTRGAAVIYNGYIGWGPFTETTIVHEFGHAANMCLNPNYSKCYDTSEIHSQGLEALYCTSGLVGNGSDGAMAVYVAREMLDSVCQSGIITDFEIWAYETEAETGTLTVDQALEKFQEILDETGVTFDREYDEKYEWASIPHLFSSPNYYISYGTSAINVIELYAEAVDDYVKAKADYLNLLYQEGIAGYVEAVEKAGLTNALDIEKSLKILDEFEETLGHLKA